MGNIYHAAYNGFAAGERLTISRHFIKTALGKMPLQKAVPSCPLFLKHIPFPEPRLGSLSGKDFQKKNRGNSPYGMTGSSGIRIDATAKAAMPSLRPSAPSCSFVVALMPTRAVEIPRAVPKAPFICSK